MISFTSPFERPFHFLALELAVLATTALVLGHAIGAYKRGDRRALFQWLVVTTYGVQMELIAFNFLDNYEHAEFSVQLYDGQLPLYVTGLYGNFMYTGIKLAERLGIHPIAEAFLAGFAICLIDVPFDLAGVSLGWWTWLDTDPVLAFRWLGVPVTSYEWYLIFGAVAAIECRLLFRLLERRPFWIAALVSPIAGSLVIVLGVVAFLPFHALAALGIDHGTLVAAHLAACAVLAVAIRGKKEKLDRPLAAVIAILPGACAVILAWAALAGLLADPGVRLGVALAALVGLVALSSFLPLRRRAPTPAPSLSVSR